MMPIRLLIRPLIFAVALLPVIAVSAQMSSPAGVKPARERRSFDDDWRFHPGHATDPHRDFDYTVANILSKTGDARNTCIRMDFDDRSWTTIQLPHDWAVALPFSHVANEDVEAHGYHAIGALSPENSIG